MKKCIATAFGIALTAFSASAVRAEVPGNPVRFCSGVQGGNYDFVGVAIKRQLPQHVDLVNTAGSLENLSKVASGECEAAIVQSDAYYLYAQKEADAALKIERASDMYPEFGHLICDTSITELSDLKRGNTIFVGTAGSGSAVMWDAIVRANPKYKEVATLPIGGRRALGKVADGAEGQCMLFVAGLKSSAMMEANEVAKQSNGHLRLTYMRDPALLNLKDAKGRPIYAKAQIPDGTYPGGLQQPGWISSGKPVDTIAVQSVLVDSVPYAEAHSGNIEKFLSAVDKARPSINDRVLPK